MAKINTKLTTKKGQVIGSPMMNPKVGQNPAWASAGPSLATKMQANPMPQMPMQAGMAQSTPMTPDAVAKRKKTMVSNAASKLMGGLYSK